MLVTEVYSFSITHVATCLILSSTLTQLLEILSAIFLKFSPWEIQIYLFFFIRKIIELHLVSKFLNQYNVLYYMALLKSKQ